MNTRDMEHAIYNELWRQGRYMCFEVKMPNKNERVDLLSYETDGTWRFFELKLTNSDFHSKNMVTFLGNYNYYVIPMELFAKVKEEIPDWVGVYCVVEGKRGGLSVSCEKKAKRQSLQIEHGDLLFSLMQALSRENSKYRKVLKTKDKGKLVIEGKKYVESIMTESQIFEQSKKYYENYDFCNNCENYDTFNFYEVNNYSKCDKCKHNHNLEDEFKLLK